MKNKLNRILGVGLTVAVLMSLIVVVSPAAPASADVLKFAPETDMPGLPTANNQFVPGSDVADMAVSKDGKTIYVVTGPANETAKSTDGGVTWKLTEFEGETTNPYLIAIAPEDPDLVVVVDQAASGPKVWISDDGGQTGPDELTGFSLDQIFDIDIAPVRSDVNQIGIVGTNSTDNGPGMEYFPWGDSLPVWTNAFTDWSSSGKTADLSAVRAIKFSPNYATDRTFVAITETNNTSKVRFEIASIGSKKWNATAGFTGYPMTIADWMAPLKAASFALASNYAGYDETTRVAFVGLASSNYTAPDGIYRFNDTRRKQLLDMSATDPTDTSGINSVAYNGDRLLAGEFSTNSVWFSDDMLASSPTVDFITTFQRPSAGTIYAAGDEIKTIVMFADTKVVAGTSGPNSAFSVSKDDGATFNDIGVFDMDRDLTTLKDVAISDNGSKEYLISDDGAWTSVWRKSATWERLLSLQTGNWQIRTDQPAAAALYVFKKGSAEIMYSDDSGEKKWSVRVNAQSAQDMAVETAKIAYTLRTGSSGSVYKTTDAGFSWGSAKSTDVGTGNVIVIVAAKQLVVGGTAGLVSYSSDSGSTWTKIDYIIEGGAGKVQVAADKIASGGNIYAASDKNGGNVLRWTIGKNTTTWDIISDADFWPIYDLQLRSPVLYAVSFDGEESHLSRTLEAPTATDATEWAHVDVAGVSFDNAPHALITSSILTAGKASGIKLWAIDTTAGNDLYSFDDTLALVGPTLKAPADLLIVLVNQTTGLASDVAYSWTRLSKATQYDIDIALDKAFTNPVRQVRGIDSNDATVAALLGPSATITGANVKGGGTLDYNFGTTYYWRARAAKPLWSPWSSVRSFTIEGTPKFNIITPTVGAVDVQIQPTFDWTDYPNAVSYEIMVSEDPTFAILTFSHTTTNTFYNSEETLNFSTTYYWRVRGVTGAAPAPDKPAPGGSWVVGTFTTQAEPTTPAPPITITPPGPTQVITVEVPTPAPIPSALLWAIIGIGAVLVIALIILIVRTRRVS